MKSLAITLLLFCSSGAWANHPKINCGPLGTWNDDDPDHTNRPNQYFVWLMSDDTVQVQSSNGGGWIQLGAVKYADDTAINDVPLADLKVGDVFGGPSFKMTLDKELFRKNQKKDRRFFFTTFTAAKGKYGSKLECSFGSK